MNKKTWSQDQLKEKKQECSEKKQRKQDIWEIWFHKNNSNKVKPLVKLRVEH